MPEPRSGYGLRTADKKPSGWWMVSPVTLPLGSTAKLAARGCGVRSDFGGSGVAISAAG
jgi:hypothetical protein